MSVEILASYGNKYHLRLGEDDVGVFFCGDKMILYDWGFDEIVSWYNWTIPLGKKQVFSSYHGVYLHNIVMMNTKRYVEHIGNAYDHRMCNLRLVDTKPYHPVNRSTRFGVELLEPYGIKDVPKYIYWHTNFVVYGHPYQRAHGLARITIKKKGKLVQQYQQALEILQELDMLHDQEDRRGELKMEYDTIQAFMELYRLMPNTS